jgi:hypothetical protein
MKYYVNEMTFIKVLWDENKTNVFQRSFPKFYTVTDIWEARALC